MGSATTPLEPGDREAFDDALAEANEREDRVFLHDGTPVIWHPQEGSQWQFLECDAFEALYEGTRGGGKTDTLLMSFAGGVGQGYGPFWRGVLFRQTYPQLADVVAKIKRWFPRMFGSSYKFNEQSMTVRWSSGEELLLRHMKKNSDYWNYHGHEYSWIGFEELTNWADPTCYLRVMSLCRSSGRNVPMRIRSTTNPYGVGHAWVKERFQLPRMRGALRENIVGKNGKMAPSRCAVHSHLNENRILLRADPDYPDKLAEAASSDAERAAWLDGDWDIIAGGMFDDIWITHRDRIVVPQFSVPKSWVIDRSMDWGESAPFSIGWWATSPGGVVEMIDGSQMSTVRGDLFRVEEYYGWNGTPNVGCRMLAQDIAAEVRRREQDWGVWGRVRPGPADTQIFDDRNGNCVATDFALLGVNWERADKGKGSRAQGWKQMRKLMKNTRPAPGARTREYPGMFVTDNCAHFLRTIPALPRDEKKMDDIDENTEDHVADEVRYRVRYEPSVTVSRSF